MAEDFRLIAHRGGVVDDRLQEESLASLEAAIRKGYWMVEIDVRATRDGTPLLQHDPNFLRIYGDERRVADLTAAEVQQLRSKETGLPPVLLDDFVKTSRGRIRLMLDFKEARDPALCRSVESILHKWQMLRDCYIIGSSYARHYFQGKTLVAGKYKALIAEGVPRDQLQSQYFLFERGANLSPEIMAWAAKNKMQVVPYINLYHYDRNAMARAHADVKRLWAAGVRTFQIDSAFDQWFWPTAQMQ